MASSEEKRFGKKAAKFVKKYHQVKRDSRALSDFAKANSSLVEELYAMQTHVSPAEFQKFKDVADELAWATGEPAIAVKKFVDHKSILNWKDNGGNMVFNLSLDDGLKCSSGLLTQIKSDLKKMLDKDIPDEWISDGKAIQIPGPYSALLRSKLQGETKKDLKDKGVWNQTLPGKFFQQVGLNPLFDTLDAWQKSALLNGKTLEEQFTNLLEQTAFFPLDYTNAVASGLAKFLKDWANNIPQKGGKEGEPSSEPPPVPDSEHGTPPPPDGRSDGGDRGEGSGRTVGDVIEALNLTRQAQAFQAEMKQELSIMKDKDLKSQALYTLLDEWEIKWATLDPKDPRYELQRATLEAQRKVLDAQLEQLRPFIMKHARDRGNPKIDAILKTMPQGDKILGDVNKQIDAIGDKQPRAPDGTSLLGEVAPDFTELYDKLKGANPGEKKTSFHYAYDVADLSVKNNALVKAVETIISDTRLSDDERRKKFESLMHGDTIWLPDDIAAAKQLIGKLVKVKSMKNVLYTSTPETLSDTPIKMYGLEPARNPHDLEAVSKEQENKILAAMEAQNRDDDDIPKDVTIHCSKGRYQYADAIDEQSGSITRFMADTEKGPKGSITYCEGQQKMIVRYVVGTITNEKIITPKHRLWKTFETQRTDLKAQFACLKNGMPSLLNIFDSKNKGNLARRDLMQCNSM